MRYILPFVFVVGLVMCLPTTTVAQISFGVGGENVESESSMIPFKIELKGVINAPRKDGSLGIVTLEISPYHETYNFDVTTAKALDDMRITSYSILQKYRDGKRNISLIGPKHMLSKVGQATPGSPLTITGFLRQRSGTLQLIRVEAPVADSGEKTPAEQSAAE